MTPGALGEIREVLQSSRDDAAVSRARLRAQATAEEVRLLRCYGPALGNLYDADDRWKSNWKRFNQWSADMQLWYIREIEKQAVKGTAMAQELVAAALAIRMRG